MKNDLRVLKTKAALKTVMRRLVQEKPINKITVTELAKEAMINKGTFYLHYTDIHELYAELIHDFMEESLGSFDYYDLFLKEPRKFLTLFIQDFKKNEFRKAFPFYDPGAQSPSIPWLITETVCKHILSDSQIEDTVKNRIRVQCCVSAITSSIFHFQESETENIIDVLTELIKKLMDEPCSKDIA